MPSSPIPGSPRWCRCRCSCCALLPAHAESRRGVRVPFFGLLVSLSGQQPRAGVVVGRRGLWRGMSLTVCWLLAIAALMRPQWIEPPVHHDKPARDLLLLVDLSGRWTPGTSPTPPAPRSTA